MLQNPDLLALSAEALSKQPNFQMQSAVVIVVKSTCFTFKTNNAPVDIARYVIILLYNTTLTSWRVDIRTPTILNLLNYQQIYSAGESQLPLTKYLELVHFLLDTLSDTYCVYYDREFTFDAFRLALHRDKLVDVGLSVLLQNDALRAGGPIWNRFRSRLAPLNRLLNPLLQTHVYENLDDYARGILQDFKLFGTSLAQPTLVRAAVLTVAKIWRSRLSTKLSLKTSLLLKLEFNASVECRRRKAAATLEIINHPQLGSEPVHFLLRGANSVNKRRVEAPNVLFKAGAERGSGPAEHAA